MRGSRDTAFAKHQREMQRQVYLPLIITGLLLVIVPVVLVIALSPYQVGTISAFMSLLLLIPAVLVCIVPYALLVASAALMYKANRWLPGRFGGVRSAMHTVSLQTNQLSRHVVRPVIWVHERYAWLAHVVSSRTPKPLLMLPRSIDRDERQQ